MNDVKPLPVRVPHPRVVCARPFPVRTRLFSYRKQFDPILIHIFLLFLLFPVFVWRGLGLGGLDPTVAAAAGEHPDAHLRRQRHDQAGDGFGEGGVGCPRRRAQDRGGLKGSFCWAATITPGSLVQRFHILLSGALAGWAGGVRFRALKTNMRRLPVSRGTPSKPHTARTANVSAGLRLSSTAFTRS